MKKILAVLIVLLCLVTTAEAELYYRFGNVVDIEWECDMVTVDDGLGNLWEFFGCDFYEYGDLVVMILADNGTPDWIYDDSIMGAYLCDDPYEIIEKNF